MEGIVAKRGGEIVARETGRGIGPALRLYREGKLRGADVADRIVGRAAAALFVAGGAVSVHADVMSEGAAEFLSAYGVPNGAEVITREIINRAKTGICPMEAAVKELDDPLRMIEAIERTWKVLSGAAKAARKSS